MAGLLLLWSNPRDTGQYSLPPSADHQSWEAPDGHGHPRGGLAEADGTGQVAALPDQDQLHWGEPLGVHAQIRNQPS